MFEETSTTKNLQDATMTRVPLIDRQAIISELKAQRGRGLSLAAIQKKFTLNNGEISTATLSNVMNEKNLDSVSVELWQRLAAYCSATLGTREWRILRSNNHELVYTTCHLAHVDKNMKMVYGRTGLGKTTSLKLYAKEHSEATYVLMLPTMKEKDCLRAIAEALNIRDCEGTLFTMVKEITRKLNNKGGLLILDDCGKVIHKFYRSLQQIYDITEGNIGIVVAGVPSLKTHISKFAMAQKESYPELMRRFSYCQELLPPSMEIVRQLCQEHGIVEDAAQRFVARRCNNYGDLRNLIMAAKRTGRSELTVELLQSLQVNNFND